VIGRWLRRGSRVPRPLRAALAGVLGALALVGVAAPASPGPAGIGGTLAAGAGANPAAGAALSKLPDAPAPGDPTGSFPTSPALVAEGYNLYESGCSSCHGIALRGQPGTAPSLIGVGAGPVDFYLSTGRMPLESPREEPQRNAPLYTRPQIDALIAYVSRFGGPAAPTADPAQGDLALGFHDFTLHCAGCHQSVARGGLTLHAVVPSLQQADAQQIAEAVRMGPYLMPHFDTDQIDQHELDSLTRYVLWTRRPQNDGGWGIYNLGPIPEGMVAWFMGLTAMVIVARLIGERLDERKVS
jgi:ubiquinol-cytochrome c reductase cytochrome c subunit